MVLNAKMLIVITAVGWQVWADDEYGCSALLISITNRSISQHYSISPRGHARSLILAPIEITYGTSYWSLIVTLVLSCRVLVRR